MNKVQQHNFLEICKNKVYFDFLLKVSNFYLYLADSLLLACSFLFVLGQKLLESQLHLFLDLGTSLGTPIRPVWGTDQAGRCAAGLLRLALPPER
jgi:hypothetical protein